MTIPYDNYYQTENLFGDPYPELVEFYSNIDIRGKLLDVGCGQGRDAIALARLGYEVTGIDYSKVGIKQLNEVAKRENLPLVGVEADIYAYPHFEEFEFILLDSMFHFAKKDKEKEMGLLKRIIELAKPGALMTICIQQAQKKLKVLNDIISEASNIERVDRVELLYTFEDKASNHRSETKYEMISIRKLEPQKTHKG